MTVGSLYHRSHLVFGFMTMHDGHGGKTNRRNQREHYFDPPADYWTVLGDPAVDITGWQFFISRPSTHSVLIVRVSLRLGFPCHAWQHAGMSAQWGCVLKGIMETADRAKKNGRRTEGNRWMRGYFSSMSPQAAVIYLSSADNTQARSLIALACLNSLCELSQKT